MKILVLNLNAPYPPYDGGSITTIEFLKALAAKHRVTFVGTFDPATDTPDNIRAHLLQYCESVELTPSDEGSRKWRRSQQIAEALAYPPSRIARFISKEYEGIVARRLGIGPDMIICNTILTGQAIRRNPARARKILNVVDVFGLMQKREYEVAVNGKPSKVLKYIEWQKTAAYERAIWNLFDALIVNSEEDAELLGKTCPTKPIRVIPTGVDIPSAQLGGLADIDLLFVGKLNYSPNVDALNYFNSDILPLLSRDRPGIRIGIVGKSPTAEVERIASQSSHYALYPNVPDVGEFYRRARAVIVPLRRGGGIKVKVLEALAYGKAVVSTSVGIYGIPVRDGQEVVVRETPEGFARAVVDLLSNPEKAAGLGEKGKVLVKEKYEWNRLKEEYLQFLEEQSARTV